MADLFKTGIRPAVDAWLEEQSKEVRNYGEYWSASSAGYCLRKNIFERLGVPHIEKESDERKQRIFSSGKIFHEWIQRITKDAGLSIAQELELQDEELMIRGHVDDLILFKEYTKAENGKYDGVNEHLILYDYKTAHSRSFHYAKDRPISYFHKMQVGTYMYMLRKGPKNVVMPKSAEFRGTGFMGVEESRVLKLSKDDLCMMEHQVFWSEELEKEVLGYWTTINRYWAEKKIPPCTCKDQEGGFMANPKYNPYFMDGESCSIKYYQQWKEQNE